LFFIGTADEAKRSWPQQHDFRRKMETE
jgi:hypothetical protein